MNTFDMDLVTQNVPQIMRERNQWVAWRYLNRKGDITKCPVNPMTGGTASSKDPATWAGFDDAVEACERDESLAGIGFVFAEGDGLLGVDLDDSIDPVSKELKPWAREIVESLNSYAEVSPSGTGVKIFLMATKPGSRCTEPYEDGKIEIYEHGRFFTVTAHAIPGFTELRESQTALETLYWKVWGKPPQAKPAQLPSPPSVTPSGHSSMLDDEKILQLAFSSRKSGQKFAALWSGNWEGYFHSPSEADSSVVFTLAFYTKDPEQIDRLFRTSGLIRPKWDERHGKKTYGQMTVDKALERVTRQYRPLATREIKIANTSESQSPDDRPEIVLADIQLQELTDKAVKALEEANYPPLVFTRGGQLVRIVHDERHRTEIQVFDKVRMRGRLSEVADFFKIQKSGESFVKVGTFPPQALAENVLATERRKFPPLLGIAAAPILRQDGTICVTPGYDAQSHLYYHPASGLVVPHIPDAPTSDEVRAAVSQILAVMHDFPFCDQASRANAFSILISLLMRPVIRGHIPMGVIVAPAAGTGKTLLASVLAGIAIGPIAAESIPAKQADDEWRKKITSIYLSAASFTLLDNIPTNAVIESSALAAALTSTEWSDRALGRNDIVKLPARTVWIATGNNLRLGGDLPRRSYLIHLDANAERPWEREGFQIGNLLGCVEAHRGELLAAAYTIIRAWYVAGKPPAKVPTLGSFEEWANTVGSVLAFAGIEGFLENLKLGLESSDEVTQEWLSFFKLWWDVFGDSRVCADDIVDPILAHTHGALDALPEVIAGSIERGEGVSRKSLGRYLSQQKGRVYDNRKLVDAGIHTARNVRMWRLESVS